MKNPTLLRHCTVENPFDNYDNVKFEEFIDFASGKIDPGVEPQLAVKEIENTIQTNPKLKATNILISSPMKRSLETCEIIRKQINKDIPIIQFQELIEVFRNPKDFSDKKTYYEKGVYQYRDMVIPDMFDNRYSNTENIQNIYKRLINVFSYIHKNYSNENLTIVYHAYPLKYTDFFVNGQISYGNFSLQDMLAHKPVVTKGSILPLKYNLRDYINKELQTNSHIFKSQKNIHKLQTQK